MYYKFKSGDEWDNLYKKERPTLKKFISDVKSNSNFKLYYHERKRIKGTDCRNILFGWRLKRDDECTIKKEDDDDE